VTVVDASIVVDALTGFGAVAERARAEVSHQSLLQVPAVFAAEVTSALRSMVLSGRLRPSLAAEALWDLRTIHTIQYPFETFVERVWELRNNLSVYDAWYVALAEWLETDLVTADAKLAAAPGPTCVIRLLA
jgi:predicted nucleic acid-binding protein